MKFRFLILIMLCSSYIFAQDDDDKIETVKNIERKWTQPELDSLYNSLTGKRYTYLDLTNLEGQKITSVSCLLNITYISFFTENCLPCREEFNKLNELFDSLKNYPNCQILSITPDPPKGNLPVFVKQFNMRYPIATALNKEDWERMNYTLGCPSGIIMDKRGRIAYIGKNMLSDIDDPELGKVSIQTILSIIKKLE